MKVGSHPHRFPVALLLALAGLAYSAVSLLGPAGAAAPKSPCPLVAASAIGRAAGSKLQAGSPTSLMRRATVFECDYDFANQGAITLVMYEGEGDYASLLKTITSNDGDTDGTLNGAQGADGGAACSSTNSGQCSGSSFDVHPVAVSGVGSRAFGQPGFDAAGGGAFLAFVWKGDFYTLNSTGPYGNTPGPTETELEAVARLIAHSSFDLRLDH